MSDQELARTIRQAQSLPAIETNVKKGTKRPAGPAHDRP